MIEKINSLNEVLYHLKEKEIITTSKKDQFVYKNDKVYRYFNGSCFVLSVEDFVDLYKNETFYLYDDDSASIDNDKDEAYYRYYKK